MDKIIVDLDGTLVNPYDKLFRMFNEKHPVDREYSIEDITDYDFSENIDDRHVGDLWDSYGSDDFYDSGVSLYPGAKEAIEGLAQDHFIILVSKPMNGHIKSKNKFMQKLCDSLPIGAYFLGKKREHIDGDILIDDKPDHLMNFDGLKLMHRQPYNKDAEFVDQFIHFSSWHNVEDKLRRSKLHV